MNSINVTINTNICKIAAAAAYNKTWFNAIDE